MLITRLTQWRCIMQCRLNHQVCGAALQLNDQVFLLVASLDQFIAPLRQFITAQPCGALPVILHHRLARQTEFEVEAQHGDRSRL